MWVTTHAFNNYEAKTIMKILFVIFFFSPDLDLFSLTFSVLRLFLYNAILPRQTECKRCLAIKKRRFLSPNTRTCTTTASDVLDDIKTPFCFALSSLVHSISLALHGTTSNSPKSTWFRTRSEFTSCRGEPKQKHLWRRSISCRLGSPVRPHPLVSLWLMFSSQPWPIPPLSSHHPLFFFLFFFNSPADLVPYSSIVTLFQSTFHFSLPR